VEDGSSRSRPRFAAILFAGLVLIPAAACEPAPRDVPGLQLAARVESHLEGKKVLLEEDLGHYGLVFPVEQATLLAFMRQIRAFGGDRELVLGTAYGFESHGGGLLALLFEHWKPEGRAPELRDRFGFEQNHADVSLAAIYASHRAQIFLPVPGRASGAIDGAIPDSPQLARMLFRVAGIEAVEVDAYSFLGLLVIHEKDFEHSWTNSQGQPLSAALLLEHARRYYLASRDSAGEPADHSNLHLVQLLLATSRRLGQDPEEIQRHFFEVELARRVFDPSDAALVVAHYAESLGRLLADPRVRWSPPEKEQARAWLAWLEENHFRDLDAVAPRHLTHLLRGLRLVREHRARLE
jgi:hypothetical protein